MEKLKDELNVKTQSYLSLNFLMADFCVEIELDEDRVENLVYSNGANMRLTGVEKTEGASDDRELYFCSTYHKYISRTFDLGKCKIEGRSSNL